LLCLLLMALGTGLCMLIAGYGRLALDSLLLLLRTIDTSGCHWLPHSPHNKTIRLAGRLVCPVNWRRGFVVTHVQGDVTRGTSSTSVTRCRYWCWRCAQFTHVILWEYPCPIQGCQPVFLSL
jgi:hypothetical protein